MGIGCYTILGAGRLLSWKLSPDPLPPVNYQMMAQRQLGQTRPSADADRAESDALQKMAR